MRSNSNNLIIKNNIKEPPFQISATALHIIGMILMTLDHIWGTFPKASAWMTCVGRIAFPIFAFLIVEGFFHTHNLKKYMLRLLIFALISEIPFDLMYEGIVFNPFHQNVLWTFLIALAGIHSIEKIKKKEKLGLTVLISLFVILATYLLGIITFADYNGPGVLTTYVFYFFRKRNWWGFLGQFLFLAYINIEMIKGFFYPVTIGTLSLELSQQGLALLALLPIWLYRGKQGYHSKPFQYFCYAFYPLHTLILYLIVCS